MVNNTILHVSPPELPKASLSRTPLPRNWQCNTCIKAFSRKGDLTRHQQLHTGFKPHVCPYEECRKEFSQNSGLKTHMNVHTRVKPYSCGIDGCLAKFGDPSSCARHKKETHRVKHPYKCPADGCISRIKRRSAFKKHLKLKHDLDPEDYDIDAMAKPTKIPASRRKSISFAQALTPSQYTPVPSMSQEKRSVVQSPVGTHFLDLRPDVVWYNPGPFGEPVRATETYYSPPTMSTTTLSGNYSAQSSTATLVEDFKYDEYTNAKLFYTDPSSGPQSSMSNIMTHHFRTPSSSPAPKSSPPKLFTPATRLDIVSAQEAYDRQRYNPSASGHPSIFQFDHKQYALTQEKDLNFDYSFNPSQW